MSAQSGPWHGAIAPAPPHAHLATPVGWMNDPNGLIHHNGQYHAFYQHHPDENVWGPMHWRHAVSHDLTQWDDAGIALRPDEHGTIFSGSAVFDATNSSGLGTADTPPLVAVFTHHDEQRGQRQSLASSTDGGATWVPFPGNPVVDVGRRDFRDPKVRRLADGTWSMVVAAGDHVEFFRSNNLIDWAMTGTFDALAEPGRSLGSWECPDLIDCGDRGWLLIVSFDRGGPLSESGVALGSGMRAVVGDFDGDRFEASGPQQWIDSGPDFYAAQTFAEQPLMMGWMGNWAYANQQPSAGTRGVLSLPRRVGLSPEGTVVQTIPLPTRETNERPRSLDRAPVLHVREGRVEVNGPDGSSLAISVHERTIEVTRSVPELPLLSHSCEMGRETDDPVVIFLDHGTLELFADAGQRVSSWLHFTGSQPTLCIDADIATLATLT